MANFRPAGFSDEDTDSDEYDSFYDKPAYTYTNTFEDNKKKIDRQLQEAIVNGNVKDVEEIFSSDLKENVNIRLDGGWTPLMHACFHAQEDIVNMLLQKKADPNLHADSMTPVMAACSNDSSEEETMLNIVTSLINHDCILNIGDKYGLTPLMRAISRGKLSVVKKILDENVNIEMRDREGWTAVFYAVHHNQPEILDLLISRNARLTVVDRSNRTPMEIATTHNFPAIIEILAKHLPETDDDEDEMSNLISVDTSWHDYYPGIEKEELPDYRSEILNLLYGMNCQQMSSLIYNTGMDLKTFLLLEENDMIKLGIDMPYERQRLKLGLRRFHLKNWKLSSVAGLYARKIDNYSVLGCLTTLGTHLQQLYVLEATLQYVLREYNKVQNQLKYEPPNSPLRQKLSSSSKKMITNVTSIRREIKNMKIYLNKISKSNPQPADLIKEKSAREVVISYATEIVILCSLGFLVYHAKSSLKSFLNK